MMHMLIATMPYLEMARNAEQSGGITVESLMATLFPQAQGTHRILTSRNL